MQLKIPRSDEALKKSLSTTSPSPSSSFLHVPHWIENVEKVWSAKASQPDRQTWTIIEVFAVPLKFLYHWTWWMRSLYQHPNATAVVPSKDCDPGTNGRRRRRRWEVALRVVFHILERGPPPPHYEADAVPILILKLWPSSPSSSIGDLISIPIWNVEGGWKEVPVNVLDEIRVQSFAAWMWLGMWPKQEECGSWPHPSMFIHRWIQWRRILVGLLNSPPQPPSSPIHSTELGAQLASWMAHGS